MIALKYLKYILIHKWYVFVECCKLGIPFLGIIHDMSKLYPGEFVAYMNNFTKPRVTGIKAGKEDKERFMYALNHHIKLNKHHWQYWLFNGYNENNWNIEKLAGNAQFEISHKTERMSFCGVFTYNCQNKVFNLLNQSVVALEIPDRYKRELLADWIGANKANNNGQNKIKEWYTDNKEKFVLHPNTREWIERRIYQV